ncbi:metallophosphoesterase family protein [Methylobacterium sp. A54F]
MDPFASRLMRSGLHGLTGRRDGEQRRPIVDHDIVYTPALDGEEVAVFGDIHGRADLLARLHAGLDLRTAVLGIAPPMEIYLGDYVDRGRDSRSVIAMLLTRRRRRRIVCLRGNHEVMMLDAIRDRACLQRWLDAGGSDTLASYGVSPPIGECEHADLPSALPAEHLAFLQSLPLGLRLGAMYFVHAGVRPGVLLEQQRAEDLLWIREPFLSSDANHGALIIHGHSPVTDVEFLPNRINIDTGAFYTGKLTCLLMSDDHVEIFA